LPFYILPKQYQVSREVRLSEGGTETRLYEEMSEPKFQALYF